MATVSYPYKRIPVLPQVVAASLSGLTLFLAVIILWTLGYQLFYAGRIFPGVSVAGVDLSGLSPADAAVKLNQALSFSTTGKILFRDGEKAWVATPAELGMVFDPSSSAVTAPPPEPYTFRTACSDSASALITFSSARNDFCEERNFGARADRSRRLPGRR